MKWTEIPTGQTNCAFQRFMGSFGDSADTVVIKLNEDDAYLNRVAVLCRNNGFEASASQQRAREIMGKNMFGIEEAMKHFDIAPTKRQLAYMAEVPYSEATLTACKDTHILVAVFPLAIVEIREKVAKKKPFYKQDWYDDQDFANDKGTMEWHLIRKTPIDDSTSKKWSEQLALLSKEEYAPKAQVMVYAIIGHFLATGERLFEKIYVRCVDLGSDGYRVLLGRFNAVGLYLDSYSDDNRYGHLAVAPSRKQES